MRADIRCLLQVFNYLFGSLTRIYTTLQEVDDKLILYGFVGGFVLNVVLAGQMVRQPFRGARKGILDVRILMTSVGLLLEQSSNSIACGRDWKEASRNSHGLQHRSLNQRERTHDPPQRIASLRLQSIKSTNSSNMAINHHCLFCDHHQTVSSNRTAT